MRIASLATACFNIMLKWIYVYAANIGIHREIPRRIEQRMGIAAFLSAALDVVFEWINALGGNLRMFSEIPGGIEHMRESVVGQQ